MNKGMTEARREPILFIFILSEVGISRQHEGKLASHWLAQVQACVLCSWKQRDRSWASASRRRGDRKADEPTSTSTRQRKCNCEYYKTIKKLRQWGHGKTDNFQIRATRLLLLYMIISRMLRTLADVFMVRMRSWAHGKIEWLVLTRNFSRVQIQVYIKILVRKPLSLRISSSSSHHSGIGCCWGIK